MTLTTKLADYPSKLLVQSFTLEIFPCIVTNFQFSPALSPTFDQIYTVADPLQSNTLDANSFTTQTPACGYVPTMQSSSALSFLTSIQSGSETQFNVYSRSIADVGDYQIQVTASLKDYPYSTVPTKSNDFKLTLLDPCVTTDFTVYPVSIETLVAFAGSSATGLI